MRPTSSSGATELKALSSSLDSAQTGRLLGEIATVSAAVGEEFFDGLVEYISRCLGADDVFVGRLELDGGRVRTLRFWSRDRIADNLTYAIAGTPCEVVVRRGFQAYPISVQRHFPDDLYLIEQGIESYLGIPLSATDGRVLGLMSILNRSTLADVSLAETVLRVFAPRAAAELERQSTEAALRESERMLAGVMSNLPGMVYRCRHDADWTLEFASDGCLALTGYSPEDLIGNRRVSFPQMIHPDDIDTVAREIEVAVEQRRAYQLVYRLRPASGEWRWVWEQGRGVFAPSGELVALEGLITDITEQRHTEMALRDSEARFRAIAENITDGVITIDAFGIVRSFNPAAERIFGQPAEDIVGKNIHLLMPEPYRFEHDRFLRRYREGHGAGIVGVGPRELLGMRRDGTVFPLDVAVGQMDISGQRMFVGIVRDITARQQAQEEMRKLSSAVEQTGDSVMITSCDGAIEYVNRAFEMITGYDKSEVLGRNPRLLSSGRQEPEFYRRFWETILAGETFREVFVNRRKDGELYYDEKTVTPLKNARGEVTHFIATGKDITERVLNQERLYHLAHHDMLTGLPNRNLFTDRLEQALRRAARERCRLALLFLDLDGFKRVNDTLGHEAGDIVLQAVASRLRACVRDSDSVARFSGDEFAILLENVTQADDTCRVAEEILRALSHDIRLEGRELRVTCSIGIGLYAGDGQPATPPRAMPVVGTTQLSREASLLLRDADAAMYRAKERGRNRYECNVPCGCDAGDVEQGSRDSRTDAR